MKDETFEITSIIGRQTGEVEIDWNDKATIFGQVEFDLEGFCDDDAE